MRILFIDWTFFEYDAETPLHRPLGGTQSAAAYLAAALAERGHQVAFINGIKEPLELRGVQFVNLPQTTDWLNSFDVLVSVSGLNAHTLRSVGCTRPLVAWCQHDIDQQAVAALHDPAFCQLFAGYAMVSEWQRQQYIGHFGLDPAATAVMRNAISPPFETTERHHWHWLEGDTPPILTYTSTPFRGLDALLVAFPMMRRVFPDIRLRIHGSYRIYFSTMKDADQSFKALYELARMLPGVELVGAVGQQQLCDSLHRCDVMAYPNTFRETSCISVMEALAAGQMVITTELGVLPETSAGYAKLLPERSGAEHSHIGMFATRYAQAVINWLTEALEHPAETREKLQAQSFFFRTEYTWRKRAQEWETWLESLVAG